MEVKEKNIELIKKQIELMLDKIKFYREKLDSKNYKNLVDLLCNMVYNIRYYSKESSYLNQILEKCNIEKDKVSDICVGEIEKGNIQGYRDWLISLDKLMKLTLTLEKGQDDEKVNYNITINNNDVKQGDANKLLEQIIKGLKDRNIKI